MLSSMIVPSGARAGTLVARLALLSIAAMLCGVGCSAPERTEQAQMQPAADAQPKAEAAENENSKVVRKQSPRAEKATKAAPDKKAESKAAASKPHQPGCATPTVASVPPHKSRGKDGGMPKLAIENKASVAPPVWPSNKTKHTFKLSNTGNAPLHIRLKGG